MSRWLAPGLLALAAHAAVAAIPVPEPAVAEPQPVRLALRAAPAANAPIDAKPVIEPDSEPSPVAAAPSAAPVPAPRRPQTADEPAVHIETDPPPAPEGPAAPASATGTSALAQLGDRAPPPAPRIDDGALDAYAAGVRRAVEAHKRYPRRARNLGHQGTVVITVSIAADGSLAGAPAVTGRSSSPLLDAEAERMARAAAPFPPPPPGRDPLRVAVPIVFALD